MKFQPKKNNENVDNIQLIVDVLNKRAEELKAIAAERAALEKEKKEREEQERENRAKLEAENARLRMEAREYRNALLDKFLKCEGSFSRRCNEGDAFLRKVRR